MQGAVTVKYSNGKVESCCVLEPLGAVKVKSGDVEWWYSGVAV